MECCTLYRNNPRFIEIFLFFGTLQSMHCESVHFSCTVRTVYQILVAPPRLAKRLKCTTLCDVIGWLKYSAPYSQCTVDERTHGYNCHTGVCCLLGFHSWTYLCKGVQMPWFHWLLRIRQIPLTWWLFVIGSRNLCNVVGSRNLIFLPFSRYSHHLSFKQCKCKQDVSLIFQ